MSEELSEINTYREEKKLPQPLPEDFNERAMVAAMLPIKDEQIEKSKNELQNYFEADGRKPDVIVVLAGGVTTNPDQTKESPLFTNGEDNNKMITGAKYRIVAAAIGAHVYPNAILETNSYNALSGARPVDVMADELQDLGIDANRIVKEDPGKESQSTFGNIARLIELMGKHADWNNIKIITNEYHLPRTNKIIELILNEAKQLSGNHTTDHALQYLQTEELTPDFFAGLQRIQSGEAQLTIVPCEQVVGAYDDSFAQTYDQLANTPEFAKRVAAERQGVYQLTVGSYKRTI